MWRERERERDELLVTAVFNNLLELNRLLFSPVFQSSFGSIKIQETPVAFCNASLSRRPTSSPQTGSSSPSSPLETETHSDVWKLAHVALQRVEKAFLELVHVVLVEMIDGLI